MQSSNLPLPCHLAHPEKSFPASPISSSPDPEPHTESSTPPPESPPQPLQPPEMDSKQVFEHKSPPTHIPDAPTTRKVTFTDTSTEAQPSQPPSNPQARLPNPRTLPVLLGRSNHARWHAALCPILASQPLPPDDLLTNLRLCRFIRATLALNVLPHVQLHQQPRRLWEKLNQLYGAENGIAAVGGGPRVRVRRVGEVGGPRARIGEVGGGGKMMGPGGEEVEEEEKVARA